jgi:hypothetical protein
MAHGARRLPQSGTAGHHTGTRQTAHGSTSFPPRAPSRPGRPKLGVMGIQGRGRGSDACGCAATAVVLHISMSFERGLLVRPVGYSICSVFM